MQGKKKATGRKRLQAVLGFLMGVFGATAIIGVLFKFAEFPHFMPVMLIGFGGEAAVLLCMGVLYLIEGFWPEDVSESGGHASDGRGSGDGVGISEKDLKEMDAALRSLSPHVRVIVAVRFEGFNAPSSDASLSGPVLVHQNGEVSS